MAHVCFSLDLLVFWLEMQVKKHVAFIMNGLLGYAYAVTRFSG